MSFHFSYQIFNFQELFSVLMLKFHTKHFSFSGYNFLEFSENISVKIFLGFIYYLALILLPLMIILLPLPFIGFVSVLSNAGIWLYSELSDVISGLLLKSREAYLLSVRLYVHREARSDLGHYTTSLSSPWAHVGHSLRVNLLSREVFLGL